MVGISCQSVWPKHNIASLIIQNALGAPENFEITIREVVPKLGAGFYCRFDWGCHDHAWFTKTSAALNMDVAADGTANRFCF